MASKKPDSARKTPRQARAQATVDSILFAAAHILATEGPERLTTNRIAEVAGVSIGSLYQYFPNKQVIVDALRASHDQFYLAEVETGIADAVGSELREALASMLRRMVDLHLSDLALHGALRADATLTPQRSAEYSAHLRTYIEENATRLRAIPDAELSAFILMKALDHLIHGVALEAPERLENPHYVDELIELAVRYLGD
jgi:AcrR family transcriptional regulator